MAETKLTITGKTITKARLLEMVGGLGLPVDPSDIHRLTLSRAEVVIETPMRNRDGGFLEARIITIPVVG